MTVSDNQLVRPAEVLALQSMPPHPGAAIRALRRERGLTLVELGARSGLSVPFLSQLENRRARPSGKTLGSVAAALSTTVAGLTARAAALGALRVTRAGGERPAGLPVLPGLPGLRLTEHRADLDSAAISVTGFVDVVLYVAQGTIAVRVRDQSAVEVLGDGDTATCTGGVDLLLQALADGSRVLEIRTGGVAPRS